MDFYASVTYSVVLESQPQWEKEGSRGSAWVWQPRSGVSCVVLGGSFACLVLLIHGGFWCDTLENLTLCTGRSCRGAGRCFCQRIYCPASQRDVALSNDSGVWWVLAPPAGCREAREGPGTAQLRGCAMTRSWEMDSASVSAPSLRELLSENIVVGLLNFCAQK